MSKCIYVHIWRCVGGASEAMAGEIMGVAGEAAANRKLSIIARYGI